MFSFTDILCDDVRVVMAMAQSMSGLLAMEAEKATVATVMVTQIVFTLCLSAVLRRMVMCRGTRKHARQLWLAHTAVALEPNDKL